MRSSARLLRRWQMATLTQAAPSAPQGGLYANGLHTDSGSARPEQQPEAAAPGKAASKEARKQASPAPHEARLGGISC